LKSFVCENPGHTCIVLLLLWADGSVKSLDTKTL